MVLHNNSVATMDDKDTSVANGNGDSKPPSVDKASGKHTSVGAEYMLGHTFQESTRYDSLQISSVIQLIQVTNARLCVDFIPRTGCSESA